MHALLDKGLDHLGDHKGKLTVVERARQWEREWAREPARDVSLKEGRESISRWFHSLWASLSSSVLTDLGSHLIQV